jgi:hypothetical protein
MTNPSYDYGRGIGCTSITGGAFVPNGVWPSGCTGGYYPSDASWATWNAPATRGWFARTLWQALEPILAAP